MTNAEKFFEIFGLEIEEWAPAYPCDLIDDKICSKHDCDACPFHNFWKKEYTRWSEENEPAL